MLEWADQLIAAQETPGRNGEKAAARRAFALVHGAADLFPSAGAQKSVVAAMKPILGELPDRLEPRRALDAACDYIRRKAA